MLIIMKIWYTLNIIIPFFGFLLQFEYQQRYIQTIIATSMTILRMGGIQAYILAYFSLTLLIQKKHLVDPLMAYLDLLKSTARIS